MNIKYVYYEYFFQIYFYTTYISILISYVKTIKKQQLLTRTPKIITIFENILPKCNSLKLFCCVPSFDIIM